MNITITVEDKPGDVVFSEEIFGVPNGWLIPPGCTAPDMGTVANSISEVFTKYRAHCEKCEKAATE